ncbi:MAG: hypothetical protein EXR98_05155 [Gemmataceae bacterium]|nr:hypothetical protein [Gemmataceae bacterium]
MRLLLGGLIFLSATIALAGGVSFQQDIDTIVRQGRGSVPGRAAWDRLSQAKADVLPALLEGMNTKDTVAANWLRLAFDRVVEREMKTGGKNIDSAKILAFVKDPAKQGRARRFALELVERLQPGTRDHLFVDALDDPEFRFEAVALVLDKARTSAKAGNTLIAGNLFRQAFEKSRDMMQARDAAVGLEAGGVKVSVGAHLGFLMDWHLIGPFDSNGQKGVRLSYPPEKKVDLSEELDGQKGKVRWKRFNVKEPAPTSRDRHQALVNLADKSALGNADDAIAFAYTEFSVEKSLKAEMRGAADDNFTVWVNGVKVFGFEEWRNGVRHDRHRFPVELKEGKNTVLVKICQSAAPNTEPNWEFILRVVDATGKGITLKK